MTTLAELDRQRLEILEITGAVMGLLTPAQLRIAPIAKVTHILLCDLCEKVSEHLAEEHRGVYPSLLTHEDQKIKNMAWGLINNDKQLKPAFHDYAKRWLKDCEFQFTEEFILETHGILDTITRRLDMEYNTIMPKLSSSEVLAQVN